MIKSLSLKNLISSDDLGVKISKYWWEWNAYRQPWIAQRDEVRRYVTATDTSSTTNSKNPWNNKTTIPKMCQVRDNLNANYMASLFPKAKSLTWVATSEESNTKEKRDSILSYMNWVLSQDRFKQEMQRCVLDYIDYGNVFATVEWVDERQSDPGDLPKYGYVGPVVRRICPLDIVFNPTADTFQEAPKIIRSLISMGQVKAVLASETPNEDLEAYQTLYDYLVKIRADVRGMPGVDIVEVDNWMQVDGFGSYRAYLESDYIELLTFHGDYFDSQSGEYKRNQKVIIADRHKVVCSKNNPSYFGTAPIFHVGWRVRQDNLWAMGPLDNLVGLQYRIDHLENLKADIVDLITYPVLKVKGYVEDFVWQPLEKIYVGDDGDVDMVAPPFQALQMDNQIAVLLQLMEEMAGSPKEAMGFRTPGEKTAFEVQRLENAASRIFQQKILQYEEQLVERVQNAMLELARRNMAGVQSIGVMDDEFKIQTFMTLTPQDIIGQGKLRPVAARHFAERAEMIQNINNFYQSGPGQDPLVRQHVSSVQVAKMAEQLLDWQDYKIIQPFIRVSEEADAQRLQNAATEQVQMELATPAGLTPDDYDPSMVPNEAELGMV